MAKRSIEIVNIYEGMPTNDNSLGYYPNKDLLQIELPFRMAVVGTSASRKTNWVLNIIKHFGVFQEIHIIARIINEKLYERFKELMVPIEKKLKRKILFMSDNLADVPTLESFSGKYNTLIILDDWVGENDKTLKNVIDLYKAGRKKNVTTIFISQNFYSIPKLLRQNLSHVVLKTLNSIPDLDRVQKEFSLNKSKKELREMYNYVQSKDPNACFLIDLLPRDPKLKYRYNFIPFEELDETEKEF
jgi:hypothetical protein